jgi:hypothetical protein
MFSGFFRSNGFVRSNRLGWQATALVHEAYLRLLKSEEPAWLYRDLQS